VERVGERQFQHQAAAFQSQSEQAREFCGNSIQLSFKIHTKLHPAFCSHVEFCAHIKAVKVNFDISGSKYARFNPSQRYQYYKNVAQFND